MNDSFQRFEVIVRKSKFYSSYIPIPTGGLHPFEERNIHPKIPQLVRDLFDNGFYSQATFEAYKFVENEVQRLSNSSDSGHSLMMKVFSEKSPIIYLSSLSTQSEIDEQKGFQFIFAGSISAIRNPRGHQFGISDSPDTCLDHISLASLLLRRLEDAGYLIS